MKLTATTPADARILRPVTIGVLVYGLLVSIGWIWVLCTLRREEYADFVLGGELGGVAWPRVLGGIHAVLGLVLLAELPRAWRAAPAVRKGQVAGIVGGLVVVGTLALGAEWMVRGAEASREPMRPPGTEEVASERLGLGVVVRGGDGGVRINRPVVLDGERMESLRAVLLRERLQELDSGWYRAEVGPEDGYRGLHLAVGTRRISLLLTAGDEVPDLEQPVPWEADADTLGRLLRVWAVVWEWIDDPGAAELAAGDRRILEAL